MLIAEGVPDDKLALAIGVGACLLGLVVWWTFMRRKRLIQDLPTSAAKGVALGLNELVGRAQPAVGDPIGPMPSPQAGVECLWWHNQFYKEDKHGKWKRSRDKRGGSVAFALTDESGQVLVRPRHAEVIGEETYDGQAIGDRFDTDLSLVTRYLSTRIRHERVVEKVIPVGADVYVLGTARLPDDSLDVYVGADPDGRHPFMVRVGSQRDALYRERVGVVVGFLLAVVGVVVATIARVERDAIVGGSFSLVEIDPVPPLVGVAGLLGVMAGASLVFVYNNLVELRQRTSSAWSLIDVQLRRRHDLIPRLARVVKGHAAHERDVQTAIADLRSHLAHDLPADPSDDAVRTADAEIREETTAVRQLVALVEAYPEMRADESFSNLRAQLVDTEDRVALAREFYNNSVTALHDRAAAFPGSLIAWAFELDLAAAFATGEQDQPSAPESRSPAIPTSS